MNKPITVARQEFAEKLVNIINESNLPAFVIAESLRSAVTEVDKLAQAQYEHDKKAWEESQNEDHQNEEI